MRSYRPRPSSEFLIVHDSHTAMEATQRGETYLRWRGRQMGLLDIGYHYVIERDGTLIECRPPDAMGSHCPGYNHNSVGVCLVGGLENEHLVDNFTADQRAALCVLSVNLNARYGKTLAVKGHTELGRFIGRHRYHPCPCLDMPTLRDQLKRFQATGELPCPSSTTPASS